MSIEYIDEYSGFFHDDGAWYPKSREFEYPSTPCDEDQLDDVINLLSADGAPDGHWYGVHYPVQDSENPESALSYLVNNGGFLALAFGFITMGIGKATGFSANPLVFAGAIAAGIVSSIALMLLVRAIKQRGKAVVKPQVVGDLKTLQTRLHSEGEVERSGRFAAQATTDDNGVARLQIIQFSPSENYERLWARVILDETAPTDLAHATERAVEVATLAGELEEQVRHNLRSADENARIEHELAREEEINQQGLLEAMDRAITRGG